MSRINTGDDVVLGHKQSSKNAEQFKQFSYFKCKDVPENGLYLLHAKYNDSDASAAIYDSYGDTADVLRNSSFVKRRETQKVMYCDTIEDNHRYFIFINGKVDPKLTAIGPNDLHTEVFGQLDGEERFAFNISSRFSFVLTEDNSFRPLRGSDRMQTYSEKKIPFSFSCGSEILVLETEEILDQFQVA